MTTFLVPSFNKNIPNKINDKIAVVSEHVLINENDDDIAHPAIATQGFPANRDGSYVFVTFIENIVGNAYVNIGFTSTATHDSTKGGYPGDRLNGICLYLHDGRLWGGNGIDENNWYEKYLDQNITRKATEIISILTISNNGAGKSVQFIVDGNESPVHECENKQFENGRNDIFPVVTLRIKDQKLECIPFNEVKSRSPKIDELMKEFNNKNKQVISAAPSTSTAENDALISQLRDRITRSQDALIQEKDEVIRNLRQLLSAKDQQLSEINRLHQQQLTVKENQISMKDEQLELERAEHQKTRNLLHQIKMELKDVELYYLRLQKESGQRRQREDEDEFNVKVEPEVQHEEAVAKKKPAAKKTAANKKK